MNAAATALPAGAGWDDTTAPESVPGPRAAAAPVASGVAQVARRAAIFVFISLGSLLAGLALLAYLL